ncbi:hypothetical protein LCGC14_1871320 [marine sediment metagenome]|uniref:Leucine-binding protein domain-containing protein n=1 Tax=marine sediment metagenome TaxID=412755 RepID=A0A0F9IIZ5_9ZZZZ
MSNEGPWRVGVLFSTSGVTSIIEKSQLKGTMLAIDEINARGGVRGRPIDPVCYNPRSVDARYGELAEQLIREDRINVIFGCYMSSSRKEVLPIVERRNALFFYPTLYEGFEYSPNVMYGGATPNQNSVPLGNHLMETYGRRIYFVGSDYVYPRESNRVMRHVIRQGGGDVVGEEYLPLQTDPATFEGVVDRILEAKPDAIFSTVVGQGCINLYRAYHKAGGHGLTRPIASLTTNEAEIEQIGRAAAEGHITAAPYFRNLKSAANRRFLASYHAKYNSTSDVTSCCEAAYSQMHLFAQALEEVGEMDPDALRVSLLGTTFAAPQGKITVDAENNHTYLHALIARVDDQGEFIIAHKVRRSIKPDPYLVYPAVNDWKFRTQKVRSS